MEHFLDTYICKINSIQTTARMDTIPKNTIANRHSFEQTSFPMYTITNEQHPQCTRSRFYTFTETFTCLFIVRNKIKFSFFIHCDMSQTLPKFLILLDKILATTLPTF